MKKALWTTLVLVLATTLSAQGPKPLNSHIDSLFPDRPLDYLTDLAGIVKNPTEVNSRLRQIREKDSLSLVVVTLTSIGNYDIADVAREIGRKWRVATANDTAGAAVRNTGGVILLVPSIRKCRVETATGSEGYMTDSRAADACRLAAANFRAGDFGAGFIAIADEFDKYHQQYMAEMEAAKRPKPPAKPFPWNMFFLWATGIGIPIFWLAQRAHKRSVEEEKRREAAERKAAREAHQRAVEAAEAERLRVSKLTPKERQAELHAAEKQRKLDEERRRKQRAEDEERHRSSYISSSDSSSSSSSSSSDSGGFSSGGSDSFGGGGGGSSY